LPQGGENVYANSQVHNHHFFDGGWSVGVCCVCSGNTSSAAHNCFADDCAGGNIRARGDIRAYDVGPATYNRSYYGAVNTAYDRWRCQEPRHYR